MDKVDVFVKVAGAIYEGIEALINAYEASHETENLRTPDEDNALSSFADQLQELAWKAKAKFKSPAP